MTARRAWLRVTVDPLNHSATVAGWQAKEFIEECGGRPIWSRTRKAWCTSESIASDVLALAQAEGRRVTFTEQTRTATVSNG